MKFEKRFAGTTAAQIVIKADSIIEGECIERILKYGYRVKGAYVTNVKDGLREFTIYPRASRKQLSKLTSLEAFENQVRLYVEIENQPQLTLEAQV